jgi:hypothetical protein
MKQSNRCEKFYEQCFQEIHDMESEHNSSVIKRFRKSVGLRDEDTLALWNLDVNGPQFLTSGKPTDVIAADNTKSKKSIALLCCVMRSVFWCRILTE